MQFCFDFIYIVWLLNEDQLWSSCRPECRFLKVGTFSKDLIFQIFKWKLKRNVALLFYMIYLGYPLKSIRPNRLVLCLLSYRGKSFFPGDPWSQTGSYYKLVTYGEPCNAALWSHLQIPKMDAFSILHCILEIITLVHKCL